MRQTGAQLDAVADEQTLVHAPDSSCSISMWMVEVYTSPAVIVKFSFHVRCPLEVQGHCCVMHPKNYNDPHDALSDVPNSRTA